MDTLISTINELQKVFSNVDSSGKEMQLPQVVVIGAQSEGKSSIIERIVGGDFLPRGQDIVTRMPLVLTIVKCPKNDPLRIDKGAPMDREFGIFDDNKETVFEIGDLSAEIERITNEKAGENKGVVDTPIHLSIYSLEGPPLALVDLPGLTEMPVGDQPPDIDVQIEAMAKSYISNTNAIILAVTGANIDIARSKALKMAENVDPNGDRTIAVFTKLDMMDRGTNAIDILNGTKKTIKLGIVGVVNRSEADRKLSLKEVDANERKFFRERYEDLADRQGCEYLKKKLSNILTEHIQKCLPDLISRVASKKLECALKQEKLGLKVQNPEETIFRCVRSFCKLFISRTKSGAGFAYDVGTKKLSPAAEISACFHERLMHKLKRIEPLKNYTTEQLSDLLKSTAGLEPDLCPPPAVIQDLIRAPVDEMIAASLKCAEHVHKKLQEIFEDCDVDSIFHRFSKVRNLFKNALFEMLREQLEETKKLIKATITAHKSYINNKYPPFEKSYAEILKKLSKLKPDGTPKLAPQSHSGFGNGGGDGLEEVDVAAFGGNTRNAMFIENVVPCYFSSIRNVVSDMVPKLIVANMIDFLDENLDRVLSVKVFRTNCASLFLENVEIEEAREALAKKLKALEEAEDILDKIGTI